MKFSTQEEYGLRCLIRIAKDSSPNGLTIPEISEMESLSQANVGKILRILRIGGFIEASRGQNGGYKLSRSSDQIVIGEVLEALGGRLFEADFCRDHAGIVNICSNSIDCSIRSLWRKVQDVIDGVLGKITLKDLLGSEVEVKLLVESFNTEEN
jgi:Rrf2 family transcriptional regulator, iron-sulfur cluster assembly transcription factor